MHISEGILSPAILGTGYILATAGTFIGLKKTEYAQLPMVAVFSALFFLASLIHIPLGPGNVHLILNGLLGLLLGWAVFPAIVTALLLQALLFQFGGLAVLGVNVLNMAFPALLCHFLAKKLFFKHAVFRIASAFLTGFLSIAGSSLMTAGALALTDGRFFKPALLILTAHIPVMFIEGIITAAVVSFLASNRPDILDAFHGKSRQWQ